MRIVSIYLLFTVIVMATVAKQPKFHVSKQWKVVNFTWPDAETYRKALDDRRYVPEQNAIANVKYAAGYYYVTLPRNGNNALMGVPATLARFTSSPGKLSPDLEPYPSWEMNVPIEVTDGDSDVCDPRLHNVKNVEIDSHNRIWILDQPVKKSGNCLPKLVIFDIAANRVFRVRSFLPSSQLDSLVVDENHGNGNGSYNGYIIDNHDDDPKILVYSVKNDNYWRVRLERQSHTIALSPVIANSDVRDVYIQPIDSLTLMTFKTSELRHDRFQILRDVSAVNGSLIATDVGGALMDDERHLYYGVMALNAIVTCRITPEGDLVEQELMALDRKIIKWPNSMTFDDQGNLVVLITNIPKNNDSLNVDEFNFRLISAHVGAATYLSSVKDVVNTTSSTVTMQMSWLLLVGTSLFTLNSYPICK